MSRTSRVLGAARLGLALQIVMIGVGLWLTPILLSRLGQNTFGVWLVLSQVLLYLGLLELGVSTLLARDLAQSRGAGSSEADQRRIIQQSARLIWPQTALALVVAVVVWLGMSQRRPDLQGPLAIVLFGMVALFPLRLAVAVLKGYQDLIAASRIQIYSWLVTTSLTVALVFSGFGIYSLVLGWLLGQGFTSLLSLARMGAHAPRSLLLTVRRDPAYPLRPRMIASLWTAVMSIAQVLTTGTDLLLIGFYLGPAAVVIYSCTGKLVSVLQQQPYFLLFHGATALCELKGEGNRENWTRAARAVSSMTLILTGFVCVGIASINEAFTRWWVGPAQFGGQALTWAMLALMIVRAWNFTLNACLASIGYERRIAFTTLADGVTSIAASVALVQVAGPMGVPLGYLCGALIASVPTLLRATARETGRSIAAVAAWHLPWLLTLTAVLAPVAAIQLTWGPLSLLQALALASVAGAVYAIAAWILTRREPLRGYLDIVLARFRSRPVAPVESSDDGPSP
jgi:O-antigen/teichoic acid export membrane protein